MVHALVQVHQMLPSGGVLVDIHDLPAPHLIEVRAPGTAFKAGWFTDKTDYLEERSAFNALAQVVGEGRFVLEDQQDLNFNIHVDGVDEMQAWLSEKWQSAILPGRTLQRLEAAFRDAGQSAEIVVCMAARLTVLRAE